MITRRSLLGGCLAAFAAPAIVRAEILMPVKKIVVPRVFPMEIGTWDGFRIIESPMLQTWGDNIASRDDYREFQRLRNIQIRRLMDNIHTANNPLNLVDRQRWVTP